MPSWLVTLVLPYVVPVILQGLTPILTEYVKKADLWIMSHLPRSSVAAVAAVIGEAINQGQAFLTGHPLPFGTSATLANLLNLVGSDWGKQPPTPGM